MLEGNLFAMMTRLVKLIVAVHVCGKPDPCVHNVSHWCVVSNVRCDASADQEFSVSTSKL